MPALATTIAAVTVATVLLALALTASVTVVMMTWRQQQSAMADADVAAKATVHNGKGAQPIAIVAVNGSHAATRNNVSEIELVWYAMAGVWATATRYYLAAVAPSEAKLSRLYLWQWLFSIRRR